MWEARILLAEQRLDVFKTLLWYTSNMIQFFVFGSSSAYGAGGENGGWADLLKQRLHRKMYGGDAIGEKYEFYNFGKSGATIDFVQNTFRKQLKDYRRDGKIIALVSIGGNNSKAENEPDNFVSTPDEYRQEMTILLNELKQEFYQVLFLGSGYVDESKTNPKSNPLTGGKSYFTNERREQFDNILKDVCKEEKIDYIEVDVKQEDWLKNYIYIDGLHPNKAGHELLAEKMWQFLSNHLD